MKTKTGSSIVWLYAVSAAELFLLLLLSWRTGEYLKVWYVLLGMAALFFPRLLARTFRVQLTVACECLSVAVIFGCCAMGEVLDLYARFPVWDDIMHLVSGFLFCAFGFAVWELRDGGGRAGAGFCFATTAGVAWEMVEYFCDRVFYTDMQKDTLVTALSSHLLSVGAGSRKLFDIHASTIDEISLSGVLDIGLYDTMNDLVMASIGAVIFLIIYRIDVLFDARLSRPFIPYRKYEVKK